MTPQALRRHIARLPEHQPRAVALEAALAHHERLPWWRTQKEHWMGWLGEYHGPGAYRRADPNRTAEFAYNHVQCSPMLLWLAEAVGVPDTKLANAARAVRETQRNPARQCAALRKEIPWSEIASRLGERS